MKFKLGKIQKAWLKSLKEHPERQRDNILGEGTPRQYKACCLGEFCIVRARLLKHRLPFNEKGEIFSMDEYKEEELYSIANYESYGLRAGDGTLSVPAQRNLRKYYSLAAMNDGGWKWPEIAEWIERNPESVFTKSV